MQLHYIQITGALHYLIYIKKRFYLKSVEDIKVVGWSCKAFLSNRFLSIFNKFYSISLHSVYSFFNLPYRVNGIIVKNLKMSLRFPCSGNHQ
jgi:hypothetical protein